VFLIVYWRQEPPDIGGRTNTRLYRRRPFGGGVFSLARQPRATGRRLTGSLAGEFVVAQALPGTIPVFLRYCLEKLAAQAIDPARDQDHRVSDIQIANLSTCVESPPVPG